MKTLLLSTVAGAALLLPLACADAADISTSHPLVWNSATMSWTGPYIGATGSIGGSRGRTTDDGNGVPHGPFSSHGTSASVGLRAGYDYELRNHVVVGAQVEGGWMRPGTRGTIGSSHAGHHQNLTVSSGGFATATGRLGYSFGRLLVYGDGGGALFTGQAEQATTNPGYAATASSGAHFGWTVGAGLEYRLTQHASVTLGWQHFDFGRARGYQTALVADGPTPKGQRFGNSTRLASDEVMVGFNYRF